MIDPGARLRTLSLAVLAAVAVAAGGQAASAATPAARPRAVVESTSANWMVVHDLRSTRPVPTGARGGAFEVTTLSSTGCVLSPRLRPPWTPGAAISLVGDSYAQSSPPDSASFVTVHVQQGCDRFTDGTPGLSSGETLVTAAPGGYLTRTDDGDRTTQLTRYRTTGGATSVPPPFSESTPWTAIAGDSGVVAYTMSRRTTTTRSRVSFMPWARPGSWTTLFSAAPRTAITCTPPSSTHVTCTVQGRGPGLLALDGRSRSWLYAAHPKACRHIDVATAGSTLVALETSNAGVCTAGRLFQSSAGGRLVRGSSTRLYSVPAGVHAGLGGILVSTADQRSVMRLKDVLDRGTDAWRAQGY